MVSSKDAKEGRKTYRTAGAIDGFIKGHLGGTII